MLPAGNIVGTLYHKL